MDQVDRDRLDVDSSADRIDVDRIRIRVQVRTGLKTDAYLLKRHAVHSTLKSRDSRACGRRMFDVLYN